MEALQALIDAIANVRAADESNTQTSPVNPPDLFGDITDDTLAQMAGAARDAATALQTGTLSEDVVAQLEVLADAVAAIDTETSRRHEAATALAARAAEISARIGPNDAAPEIAAAADDDTDSGNGDDPEPDSPQTDDPQPGTANTAAAANLPARTRPRVDLSTLRRNSANTRTIGTSSPATSTVTAAADLPGYGPGSRITSVRDLSAAVRARFDTFPIGSRSAEVRGGIATIKRNFSEDLVASGAKGADEDMLDYACDERRLPGGSLAASITLAHQRSAQLANQPLDSLVAALSPNATLPGAINSLWCAPYEIDTMLCSPLETSAGYLDLPTVGVRPPGVIYTQGLDWWNLFDFTGLVESCDPCFTKTCVEVPCPEWTQADVSIEPFCIQSCILKERTFQSWYDLFVRRSMSAFRRWQNIQALNKVLALVAAQDGTNTVDFSVAPPPVPTPWGTAHTAFDSLGLVASWYRDLYRMDPDATLEIVAPHWMRDVLRNDMAKRIGCGCEDVTNAQIDGWFSNRGLRVQYIYDWQTLVAPADLIPATGDVPCIDPPQPNEVSAIPAQAAVPPPPTGIPTPIKEYPATYDVLMFPAGTFVAGRVELFRMDGVYSGESLRENQYTKIFFEDGVTVMQRCWRALRIKLPVCMNGGNVVSASQPLNPPCGLSNQVITP